VSVEGLGRCVVRIHHNSYLCPSDSEITRSQPEPRNTVSRSTYVYVTMLRTRSTLGAWPDSVVWWDLRRIDN
jgi:hypothetical protein